jgi:hypothetical protein
MMPWGPGGGGVSPGLAPPGGGGGGNGWLPPPGDGMRSGRGSAYAYSDDGRGREGGDERGNSRERAS